MKIGYRVMCERWKGLPGLDDGEHFWGHMLIREGIITCVLLIFCKRGAHVHWSQARLHITFAFTKMYWSKKDKQASWPHLYFFCLRRSSVTLFHLLSGDLIHPQCIRKSKSKNVVHWDYARSPSFQTAATPTAGFTCSRVCSVPTDAVLWAASKCLNDVLISACKIKRGKWASEQLDTGRQHFEQDLHLKVELTEFQLENAWCI